VATQESSDIVVQRLRLTASAVFLSLRAPVEPEDVQEWLEPMTMTAAQAVNEAVASRGTISVDERELIIRTAEVRVTQFLLLVAEMEGYDIHHADSPIPEQPQQFTTFQINEAFLGLCPFWPIC
jgi:hypothetical protein